MEQSVHLHSHCVENLLAYLKNSHFKLRQTESRVILMKQQRKFSVYLLIEISGDIAVTQLK